MKALLTIMALVAVLSITPVVFADTTLVLNRIPSEAYEGQIVTFTGTLYSNGLPLTGKTVWIQEDDPFQPDDVLASGLTDRNGQFSIKWRVVGDTFETEFDIYAIFEGDAYNNKYRTGNQYMDVYELRGATITLHNVPEHIYAGKKVTFTGTLTYDGQPLAGKKIWIQDVDRLREDDYLKSGVTDKTGRFHITWTAQVDSIEVDRDIRAVFEGDSSYGRVASYVQEMQVTKIGGDIILDPFTRTAKVSETVTFSGTLSLDRGSPKGSAVYLS